MTGGEKKGQGKILTSGGTNSRCVGTWPLGLGYEVTQKSRSKGVLASAGLGGIQNQGWAGEPTFLIMGTAIPSNDDWGGKRGSGRSTGGAEEEIPGKCPYLGSPTNRPRAFCVVLLGGVIVEGRKGKGGGEGKREQSNRPRLEGTSDSKRGNRALWKPQTREEKEREGR